MLPTPAAPPGRCSGLAAALARAPAVMFGRPAPRQHASGVGPSLQSSTPCTPTPAGGGEVRPGQQFQRWLDAMRQQGYSVAYDAASGKIWVEGKGGKLKLYTMQEPPPSNQHLSLVVWNLACGAGGTFLTLKAYGPEAACIYFGAWTVVIAPNVLAFLCAEVLPSLMRH